MWKPLERLTNALVPARQADDREPIVATKVENQIGVFDNPLSSIENWGDVLGQLEALAIGPSRAMKHSAVFACVRLIAGTIAALPFKVYEDGDEAPMRRADHPLQKFLTQRPNPQMSATMFWRIMLSLALLTGNGYAWIERKRSGAVIAIWPLAQGCCKPIVLSSGLIAYEVTLTDGTRLKCLQDDILHLPGSCEWIGGQAASPLSSVGASISVGLEADRYAATFFKNDATPPGYLSFEKVVGAELAKRIKEDWYEKTGGANRFRIPVLSEGGTFKQLQLNAEDAQLLETRRFAVEDIARIFGVPPHMIGAVDKTTSWGTGIEQQSIGFVQYTLQPHLTAIEQELKEKLFSGSRYFVEVDVRALMRGDFKTRNEGYRQALGGSGGPGYMTPNEVRALENLPKIDGGDTLATWEQKSASAAAADGNQGANKDPAAQQKDSQNV